MTDAVYIQLPKVLLNQSRLKDFQGCKRYFGWLHVENLAPRRKRKQLVTGTAVHRAQVKIHDGGATDAVITEATEEAARFFEREMTPDGPKLEGDEDIIREGTSTLRRILPAYHKHWKAKGQSWRPLGQELDFCVEVGEGTNVFLVGTIDNLAVYMQGLWIVDYKTMAKLDMREFTKYQIDIQLTAYAYGGTKQLAIDAKREGKTPVVIRGAIIDGMVKTNPPQFHREEYTRTKEDFREFEMEFCMEAWDIASRRAMLVNDRTAYNLFKDKMFDLGAAAGWKTAFPKSTQRCFQYGTCIFHDVCTKDNDTRRSLYTQRTPDYVDRKVIQLTEVQ